MEYLAKLEEAVLGFSVKPFFIDCLSGRKLYKIQKESGEIIYEKEVFEKVSYRIKKEKM